MIGWGISTCRQPMHRTLANVLLWGALAGTASLIGGCALTHARVNGEWVPRENQEYMGQPYLVHHDRPHPQPGGPSSGLTDHGGTIHGEVCGARIYYVVEHLGDSVQLTGQLDNRIPSELRVIEQLGGINVAGRIGQQQIDLQLSSDRLVMSIDEHVYNFHQRGDELISSLYIRTATGTELPPTASFEGASALFQMPPSVQAAILPLMVHCMVAVVLKNFGAEIPTLGFGGPQTALPRGTLLIQ